MKLNKLSILSFKNIEQAELEFSAGINCFTGSNGAGKTNLIDSIHYLSMCKSSLSVTDTQSLRHGADFFMLQGDYTSDGGRHESVVCSFKYSGGKKVKRNGKEYEKLSDHIGVVPVVLVSPSDVFLVNEAADERRRWLNAFISQLDKHYLATLIRYNNVLAQRNRLLKQLSESGSGNELMEILDEQLAMLGTSINRTRADYVERLRPLTAEYYSFIAEDREQVEITYRSELNDRPFDEILDSSSQKDLVCQFTTSGIHRDDIVMKIGGYPLKKYGSQGQQKSFLIALKLAQHRIIAEQTNEQPLLLLDDLFDKLDVNRLERLIDLTGSGDFGQIFISDCNRSRIIAIFDACGVEYSLFDIDGGEVMVAQKELES